MAQASGSLKLFQPLAAHVESLAGDPLKKGVERLARRDFKVGENVFLLFQVHVATVGDFHRARDRFRKFGEDRRHFFVGLEIELLGGELHAIGIA